MGAAGESIETIGLWPEFLAQRTARAARAAAEDAHAGEVVHAHRVEGASPVDRTQIERSGRGREFARTQADDLGGRRDPPEMPRRIRIIGRAPTAAQIHFVVGTAHAHEVSRCGQVGARCRRAPPTDRPAVEPEHDGGREGQQAEEDPRGHAGEVRRARPRPGCR